MNAELAYTGAYQRFVSSLNALGLSDKEIARRTGISTNTPSSWRQREKLPDVPTLFKLRAWLGERWWAFVMGNPNDWSSDEQYEAEVVALEVRAERVLKKLRGQA